jgi:hypothetical protein
LTGYGGGLERKRLLLDLESGVLPLMSDPPATPAASQIAESVTRRAS